MKTVYWIYKNGHQNGPFTFSKIQTMWNAGTISIRDQIRRMDQQEWSAVSKIGRHLESGRNELRFNPAAVIILGLLSFAFLWSFVLVWWLYS